MVPLATVLALLCALGAPRTVLAFRSPILPGMRQPVLPLGAPAQREARKDPQEPSQGTGDAEDLVPLRLCECEDAGGNHPDDLSCRKDGWFLTGYKHEGSWLVGGGVVPLSPARCCRPCVDEADLPSGTLAAEEAVVGVTELGCHRSTAGPQCEVSSYANSFATGWISASPIFSASFGEWFPLGPPTCCTPQLLLSSGRTLPIVRCNCVQDRGATCAPDTGAVSPDDTPGSFHVGYTDSRNMHLGSDGDGAVPLAPSKCCGMCIDPAADPPSCRDLSACHGNGRCVLGACECFAGFTGSDCSRREATKGGILSNVPLWLLIFVAIGAVGMSAVTALVFAKIYLDTDGFTRRPGWESEEEEERQPLLDFGSDDHGSVGSVDTDAESVLSDEEVDGDGGGSGGGGFEQAMAAVVAEREEGEGAPEGETRRRSRLARRLPLGIWRRWRGRDAGSSQEGDGAAEEGADVEEGGDDAATGEAASEAEGESSQVEGGSVAAGEERLGSEAASVAEEEEAGAEQDVAHHPMERETPLAGSDGDSDAEGEEKPAHGADDQDADDKGLPGTECCICYAKPVQVATVPCGHAAMCRRCSRRMLRCPICRVVVARRQKLYVAGGLPP
ncbi:unnamed protein product [Pedinophyceae sp. YPF-701]|nr:unnamed protein product [Pedinophyceae sp. YPF-701]